MHFVSESRSSLRMGVKEGDGGMKRLFDIIASLGGLVVAAPFMLAIAAVIKLESKGPVFYRCKRVGRNRLLFGMLKFRTMMANADNVDCKLCGCGDVRVTSFGRFLRRTKLNELPQLFNVLLGDMSAVGPRPEDPKFTRNYNEQWQVVLSVRPGIVGPNQILNRNEEDLFPPGEDHEHFYIDNILPEKLARDIEYVRSHTFWGDVSILFKAVYVTLFKGFTLRRLLSRPQILKLIALDAGLSLLAYLLANLAKYETVPIATDVFWNFVFIAVANPIIFLFMGVYKRSVRFISVPDIFPMIRMSLVCGMVLIVMNYFFMIGSGHARSVYFLYPLFLMFLITGTRVLARIFLEQRELMSHQRPQKERLLIYGAGRMGMHALRRFQFEPGIEVVGFVDDDPDLKGGSVFGVPVLGSGCDLPFLKSLYQVDKVFIGLKPSGPDVETNVRRRCVEAAMTEFIDSVPEFRHSGNEAAAPADQRYFDFVSTLGIKSVSLNTGEVAPFVQGSTIALVGAGDRFGEELCLELVNLKARGLVLIEDCAARLERIVSFLQSIRNDHVAIFPYFFPLGSLSLTEKMLAGHNPEWIIYHRPNRPLVAASLNQPTQVLTEFAEAAGFVEMAKRLGCDGFSFLSPYTNDSFSPEEKKAHLLTEIYVRSSARYEETQTRFGVVRLANVLENENDVFVRSCNKISRGMPVSEPSRPLAFASAQNAARICLNSLPLHGMGDTFAGNSTVSLRLQSLIEHFFRFQGDGRSLDNLIRSLKSPDDTVKIVEHSASSKAWTETTSPYLLKVNEEPEVDMNLIELFKKMNYFHGPSCYGLELPRILSILEGAAAA